MIAAWMLYATLVAGLLYGAGLVLERAPAALGRSRRWVWAGTIGASVALPLAVALRRGPFAAESRVLPAEAAVAVRRTLEPIVAAGAGTPGWARVLDTVLVGGWIAASLTLLLLLLRGRRALDRVRSGWADAGAEALGVRPDELETLTAGSAVRVTDDHGPAVTGLGRSEILLPRWCLDLTPGERALILAHEGEHVRGGDPRLLFAARLAAIALPWLLPVWWQLRRLRLAVEIDCDARVLRRGFAPPPSYGRLLLQVGSRQSTHRDHSRAIAALAAPSSQLERRIRAMFDGHPRARWVRATAAVAIATGLVVVACESPTPFETQEETAVPADAEYSEIEASRVVLRERNQALDASLKEIEGSLRRLDKSANEFTLYETKPDANGNVAFYRESGEPVAELELMQRKAEVALQELHYGEPATGGVLRKVKPEDGGTAKFHLREDQP